MSETVVDKILDRAELQTNVSIKQEFLSALGSIIQTSRIERIQSKVEKLLMDGLLMSRNVGNQMMCARACGELMRVTQVDPRLIGCLVDMAIKSDCDESVREKVHSVIVQAGDGQHGLTQRLRNRLELAIFKWDGSSRDDLIDVLRKFGADDGELLEQNYNQLAALIEEEHSSQTLIKALDLLKPRSREITSELVESITVLCESTQSSEVKVACMQLLEASENISSRVKL